MRNIVATIATSASLIIAQLAPPALAQSTYPYPGGPQIQPPRDQSYAGTLRCESRNNKTQRCNVRTDNRVDLIRVIGGPCSKGRDWCFTKNQISAAIFAFAANFLLWMLDLLADKVSVVWVADSLKFLSLYSRYEPFILGQLSVASVLYFITFILLCLMATVRVMDARRFSQGGAA